MTEEEQAWPTQHPEIKVHNEMGEKGKNKTVLLTEEDKNWQVVRQMDWKKVGLWGGVSFVLAFTIIAVVLWWNRRLAHEVSERRRAEKELNIAKDAAEAAARAKSNFLANMSHEIRTPMNSVLGFLSLVLEDSALSEVQRGYLATANNSARMLLELINSILDLSKFESGKLALEERPFNLAQMLEDILATMKIKAQEKGLTLTLDIHPHLRGNFIGDSFRLRQILTNLIINAIKFTEKGSVKVTGYWDRKEFLHFAIADTGIGISSENIERIFESFTQADSSTSRRFGGTGLGTTISKQLVCLMGGRIRVESEVGKGSTFHFTVRMQPTESEAYDPSDEWQDFFSEFSLPESWHRFHILLAEDIETNIILARIRLQRQGHSVVMARNGLEAVEKFQRGGIELILMDIHMPEMDGLEAVHIIREIEKKQGGHVPIIATTASVMKEERKKYLEEGIDAIIGKPINFAELFAMMEKSVSGDSGQIIVKKPAAILSHSGFELPLLEGIDVENGLRTWGEARAYVKALLEFSRKYGKVIEQISDLIEKGEFENACQITHSIKGLTGNLSMTEAFNASAELNTALNEKRIDDAKRLLSSFAAALETAVVSIRAIENQSNGAGSLTEKPGVPDGESPPKERSLRNGEAAIQLFQKIMDAFEQYNPRAVEPFLGELNTYFSSSQLAPAKKCLDQFDIDGARDEMIKLAEHSGIHLEKQHE
ncbi:MAG: response regulator [Gammaproteobacteria bacterium]|nr:response regulator [Gammaproteobacteria bacterium]